MGRAVGLAFDGSGNLFVGSEFTGLLELTAASNYTTVTNLNNTFVDPLGVAIDGTGNLFVTDLSANTVTELFASTNYTTSRQLGSGWSFPQGIALDGVGNVFVVDRSHGVIRELTIASNYTQAITLAPTFNQPGALTIDGLGNLFVLDFGTGNIFELSAANGYQTLNNLHGGFQSASGLAIDANGNLFIANPNTGLVQELLAAGGYTTVNTLSTSNNKYEAIALNGTGNIFLGDYIAHTITKFDFVTPPTLNFATTYVGQTSTDSPQNVTLLNNGNADLHFVGTPPTNNPSITAGFTFSNSCPTIPAGSALAYAVTPGGGCTYIISYKPVAPGVTTGKLTSTDDNLNIPASTQSILLNATGLAVPTTTTTLTSSLNPSVLTNPVTFTATLTSASATPTGTVTFTDGAVTLGTQTLTPSGTAAITTAALTAGTHTITATYTPTGNFTASSASLTQTVNLIPSTSTLTVNPTTASAGLAINLTATVTPAAPGVSTVPTGTVQFFDGATHIGTPLLVNGIATLSVNTLAPGIHSITCTYTGDFVFATSACNTITVTINPAPTTLTLASSQNPAPALSAVSFTARLASTTQVVSTGNLVTFTLTGPSSTTTITAATDTTGTATFTSAPLLPGTYILTATFPRTGNLGASTAAPLTETIISIPTTTTVTAAPNPGAQNQPITLVATVAASVGTNAPLGFVTFFDSGAPIGTGVLPVVSGTTIAAASLVISTLAPGTHSITALYSPASTAFTASTSAPLSLVIVAQNFTLTTSVPSITIQTEHHASLGVTLTSIGGLTGQFALSCGSLPVYASCNWQQTTVTLPANGAVTTNLLIDTDVILGFKSSLDARPQISPQQKGVPTPILAALLPVALFGLLRRRKLRALLPLLLLSAFALSLTACSGKYPGHTPPGTYTIQITATGQVGVATYTHTTPITLIVTE